MHVSVKKQVDNTNNYNNHHGDYSGDYCLTMSLRINTEKPKYTWCSYTCCT